MAFTKNRELLSSSAEADGDWVFVGDSVYKAIHFGPLESGGIVEVRGSNDDLKPAVGEQDALVGVAITSGGAGFHGVIELAEFLRWVRFRKTTAAGSPETTVARLNEQVST